MSRLIVLLNIDGLFVNSIQLRLSSSRKNAIWIKSLASRDRVSIMVGWYWCIAEPRWTVQAHLERLRRSDIQTGLRNRCVLTDPRRSVMPPSRTLAGAGSLLLLCYQNQ